MADPPTKHTDKPTTTTIQDFLSPITVTLSEKILYQLSYRLSKTYKDIAAYSTEQFFPTPITHLPTGKERGRYLAVYVGLFYLHVGFIELLGCDDEHRQRTKGEQVMIALNQQILKEMAASNRHLAIMSNQHAELVKARLLP